MKSNKSIKLLTVAVLASAGVGVATLASTQSTVFASEVTQQPNPNNVGTRTHFETDAVFDSYDAGNKYLETYVKPTIEASRYGYYTATVVPDGLGGKYLVEGNIDSHSEDATIIAGNKTTAEQIIANAGKQSVTPIEEFKEISGSFTEVTVNSEGIQFKAKLSEPVPHSGGMAAYGNVTLINKATGEVVAKTVAPVDELSDDLNDKLLNFGVYSNLLKGKIGDSSLTPGIYTLTISGRAGAPYGQNSDKKKRVFTFSTDVTIPAKEENKPQPQPNPDKDKPQPDKNKPDRDKPQPDKNKPDTKPTKDKDLEQPNSDGDLQFKSKQDQPRKDDTKSTTNKQEDNDGKKEVKKALPNTGEATSILGVIGAVLAFVGAGLVAKRKRG